MASRVFFGLANQGYLPRRLARVSERTQTPIAATALVVLIIVILTQAFPIEALAEKTSQIVLIVFVLVNLALLRVKRQVSVQLQPQFTVPWLVPVFGAMTSLALLTTALL